VADTRACDPASRRAITGYRAYAGTRFSAAVYQPSLARFNAWPRSPLPVPAMLHTHHPSTHTFAPHSTTISSHLLIPLCTWAPLKRQEEILDLGPERREEDSSPPPTTTSYAPPATASWWQKERKEKSCPAASCAVAGLPAHCACSSPGKKATAHGQSKKAMTAYARRFNKRLLPSYVWRGRDKEGKKKAPDGFTYASPTHYHLLLP